MLVHESLIQKTTVSEAVHLCTARKQFTANYSVCVCVFYKAQDVNSYFTLQLVKYLG
jgi:hypothetical protein